MRTNFYKVYIILVFLVFFKIQNNGQPKFTIVKKIPLLKEINIEDTMTLTKPNIEYLVYNMFKDSITNKIDSMNAEYTIKQIYLESGHLKSFLSKKNNNLTGMRHPRIRQTTSLGEKNGYAYYKNWIDCVKDIYLWRKANNLIGVSENVLLKSLRVKYAQDPNYTEILSRIRILKDDRTDM
jgi:uncharacterized FlgJ-related protein